MNSTSVIDQPRHALNTPTATHLHGILNVYKPAGWTSHDVVLRLRRLLGIRKVGHAGTLDPAATGVLPVLLGKGTKIADHLLGWEKEYVGICRLGQSTETQDATGKIIGATSTDAVTEGNIRSVVQEFQGTIQQIPPMYSAVKVNGQPLYKAARRGKTIKRNARTVTIHELEVLAVRGSDIELRVLCSKGTYIRTLCADIGDRLHVGGHLRSLERSRVGPFHVQEALDVEDLTIERLLSSLGQAFMPIDDALAQFPIVVVKSEHVGKVLNGAPIPCDQEFLSQWAHATESLAGQRVRIRGPEGQLLAIGRLHSPVHSSANEARAVVCTEIVCIEK